MELWSYFQNIGEVISIDGNIANKMATQRCQFWVAGIARYASNRWWPTMQEADDNIWGKDAPYEAFRRSCENIIQAWYALIKGKR